MLNDVACNDGIEFQCSSHLLRITLLALEAEDCGTGHDAECGHLRKVTPSVMPSTKYSSVPCPALAVNGRTAKLSTEE